VTAAVVASVDELDAPDRALTPLIASAIGTNNRAALATILTAISQRDGDGDGDGDGYDAWKLTAVAQLIDRLDRSNQSLDDLRDDGAEDDGGAEDELNAAVDGLGAVLTHARAIAADEESPVHERQQALRLVAAEPESLDEDLELLALLLEPTSPTALQLAAVERLGGLGDSRVPDLLLGHWSTYSPALRREVMTRMFERRAWLEALLDAIEQQRIDARDIDAARRQRLVAHEHEAIRRRAESLLAVDVNSDRQQVVDAYRQQMPSKGDPERGRPVFEKRCAVCHQWQDMGHAVGPDLAALSDRSTEAMLIAVLDPNRALESRYTSYTAITDAGRTFTGLLVDETGGAITLLEQEGKRQVVQRGELEALESSRKSLMPEGLEKDLTPAQLADVFALVQSTSASPKDVPGNQPELVRHEYLRGEMSCLASNAEIYGKTLRIEEVNGSLGWWNSDDDRVVWEIEVENPGLYNVLVEFSCDASVAGNRYTIEVAGQTISREVTSTGDWNVYHRPRVGSFELPQGRVRLTVRPDGPIREALMDLKSVTLRPDGV
jgi:putative heme-binding domain-containing protein